MRRAPDEFLHGICELTLEARDPSVLERFYREVLGCDLLAREDGRIWLSCGERTRLGLWTRGAKEFGDRGGRHVHFAFSVPPRGLDRLRARLEEHGVAYQGPIVHDGGDRSVYLNDPEDNVLEVWDFFEREPEGVDALAG